MTPTAWWRPTSNHPWRAFLQESTTAADITTRHVGWWRGKASGAWQAVAAADEENMVAHLLYFAGHGDRLILPSGQTPDAGTVSSSIDDDDAKSFGELITKEFHHTKPSLNGDTMLHLTPEIKVAHRLEAFLARVQHTDRAWDKHHHPSDTHGTLGNMLAEIEVAQLEMLDKINAWLDAVEPIAKQATAMADQLILCKVAAAGDGLGEGDVVPPMCKVPGCQFTATAGGRFCEMHQSWGMR
jgi:hypothetical protein